MIIDSLRISNFANIGNITIELADITALVAPNNYGKSNVIQAINFAAKFIEDTSKGKERMLSHSAFAPINSATVSSPCIFEILGKIEQSSGTKYFRYSFSFRWDKGIIEERLELRIPQSQRFIKYIERRGTQAKYLPTPGGRCNKNIDVDDNILVLNKLANFDELFYIDALKQIEHIDVKVVDTLISPESYFILSETATRSNEYSTAFPSSKKTAYFIYSLKMLYPDRYELLCDAVKQMLPNIESIEVVKINLSDPRGDKETTDKLYDIRIKEFHNTTDTSINRASSGSKKIVYLLALTIAAEMNNIPLLTFEELENSVHPRLLQSLLSVIRSLAGNTKVLTTSHSPYFIKYLNPAQIYLGLPESSNLAVFYKLKPTKVKKVMRLASSEEISLGEYLFEMMLDMHDDETIINEYFI